MSLTNALSNAMSGLAYAGRGTEVVASNIANAQTPGYARRELQLSPRSHIAGGGGVQIDSIARVVQQSVLAQQRLAGSDAAGTALMTGFASDVEQAIGVPGEPGSLTATLADFEAALASATSRPDSETRLSAVLSRAGALAGKINRLGVQLTEGRTNADAAIATDVARLNDGLGQVAELNRSITVQIAQGNDASSLMDRRQALISSLAEIVPLQELPRDNGRVALVTAGGALLLDGSQPMRIGFRPTVPVTPGMTVGSPLALLTIDDADVTAGQMSMFAGGTLGARFTIRDQTAPELQSRLDALALDLVDRAADAAVDPTLPAGSAGLFTDDGDALRPADPTGLAGRLAVNPRADPATGGALWRLRDGMAAAAPSSPGDPGALGRLADALARPRLPAGAPAGAAARSAQVIAADMTSTVSSLRLSAEAAAARATAQHDALSDMMRSDGVDTDRELENLLGLERAYAANAKVLKAVDDMLLNILGLT